MSVFWIITVLFFFQNRSPTRHPAQLVTSRARVPGRGTNGCRAWRRPWCGTRTAGERKTLSVLTSSKPKVWPTRRKSTTSKFLSTINFMPGRRRKNSEIWHAASGGSSSSSRTCPRPTKWVCWSTRIRVRAAGTSRRSRWGGSRSPCVQFSRGTSRTSGTSWRSPRGGSLPAFDSDVSTR